jgi:autotransporter family porin
MREHAGRLVFRVPPLRGARIHSGLLISGTHRARFDQRRLLASLRRGRLTLRVPAAWRRPRGRHGGRPRYVLLLVLERPDPVVPAPPSDTAPGTGTDAAPPAAGGDTGSTGPTKSLTRPVGSPPLADAQAAAHVTLSSWEPRSDNALANGYSPSDGELASFYAASKQHYLRSVSGRSTLVAPTTDELIQWAAWKWGLDEDVLRAVAVQESDWRQSMLGDYRSGPISQTGCAAAWCPTSFGITQIKDQWHDSGHGGTWPLAQRSTPFNLDYYGRWFRSCYDGNETWLRAGYAAGDEWGCVGAWFSGGWHDSAAEGYLASVKNWLANRTWTTY